MKFISEECIKHFISNSLLHYGCNKDMADAVGAGLSDTSARGIDSHGIRLYPHYVRALKGGRINPNPNLIFTENKANATLNADHAFGHYSGAIAMEKAVALASQHGISAVSINNSTHFGAASVYSLPAARKGFLALSFTNASPLLKSPAGKSAFFGANPICFCAPIEGEEPFCLDMSTTQITWNSVKMAKTEKRKIRPDVAYDKDGEMTTDPSLADQLAPMGGYKGFGLSVMIDILCGVLSGMPYGKNVTNMYSNPISDKRYLGHFVMAIDISTFLPLKNFTMRMKNLAESFRNEPAVQGENMIPGDPEKKAFLERSKNGIPVSQELYEELLEVQSESKQQLIFINS